jgi:immunoglobulin-like protein involved in spore germination
MSDEERLERAMHAYASTVTPTPDWDDVEQRAEELRRRRLRRRAVLAAVGLAAAIVLVVALIPVLGGDDETTVAVTAPSTTTTEPTTTSSPTSTSTTTAVPPVPARPQNAIWPFPGGTTFRDPGAAAVSFARYYLRMPDPTVESTALSARVVEIRARRDRPVITSVTVAESGGDWYVTGARTKNIDLVSPEAGDHVASPVRVTGTSTAFEAHVNWEVREESAGPGRKLGEGFFMGGSNGQFGPFDSPLSFSAPTRSAGAIVLFTRSAEDGAVQEATVVPVAFG